MAKTLFLSAVALVAVLACATPQQPPPGASGAEIYALQLCSNCHGDAGQGNRLGPPLRDLATRWTREELADFFADPDRWEAEDARLGGLADEYSGDMKTYENLSLDERLRLADHVLGM